MRAHQLVRLMVRRLNRLHPRTRVQMIALFNNLLHFCEDCGYDRCVCDEDAGIEEPRRR